MNRYIKIIGWIVGVSLALAVVWGIYIVFQSDTTAASFLIAALAAAFAGYSILISRNSYRLTSSVNRPFLTTVNEPEEPKVTGEKDNPRVILHIKNTGNLPADRISVLCVLYTANNKDIGISLHHAKTALAPPTYFPGVTVGHTFYLEKEHFHECQKGRFTIRIFSKYDNRISKKTCRTQRSFIYEALATTPQTPINSTHRDDWWD